MKKIINILNIIDKKFTAIFFLILFLSLIGVALESVGIALVFPLLNFFSNPEELFEKVPKIYMRYEDFLNNTDSNIIAIYLLVFIAFIFVIKNIYIFCLTWYVQKFSHKVMVDLSSVLFKKYLTENYNFHLTNNSNYLIKNTIDEVNNFTNTLIPSLVSLFTETILVIILIFVLVATQPPSAMLSIVLLTLVAYLFIKITKSKVKKWGNKKLKYERLRFKNVRESLGLIKDIIILDKFNFFLKKHNIVNSMTAKLSVNHMALQQAPRHIFEIFAIMSLITIIVIFFQKSDNFYDIIPYLGLFTVALYRIMPSANRIVSSLNSLYFGKPIISLIFKELTDYQTTKLNYENSIVIKEMKKNLKLKNIFFKFNNSEDYTIKQLDLELVKGKSVGVFGDSGGGKSTLNNIITGLLKPNRGDIILDEKVINLSNIKYRFDFVGHVPQNVNVYEDKIKYNIALGVEEKNIDHNRINKVINDCELNEFIQKQKDGIESLILEEGKGLSGGEKQRLGLARALYFSPSLIVLDEATSALDSFTESQILKTIEKLKAQNTFLIISHKLEILDICDEVFKLSEGNLKRFKRKSQ